MSAQPLWMESPHILRWCKRLMEYGLAEDGKDAEAIYRASPWHPLPEEAMPSDSEFIKWARDHVRATRPHEHGYEFNAYCGAHVCDCGDHRGLARCYCGWSLTQPGDGYQELIEMGETIEPY